MIRILRHTLCLALLLTLAACEKDREPRIEVSTGEIHLPGDASSGTTFTVSAEEPWTLSYTGEGFAVTPDGGARGETTVTVTASEPNSAKARRKLGTITVRHPANKDGYPVEVYQRPAVATQTLLLYMPGRSLIDYYERNIEGVSATVTNQIPGDGAFWSATSPRNIRRPSCRRSVTTRRRNGANERRSKPTTASTPETPKRCGSCSPMPRSWLRPKTTG